jgi:hypothetical protein
LCFNHEEFCDVLKAHRKTLAFTVFAGLSGLLDGRVASGSSRQAAFGASR